MTWLLANDARGEASWMTDEAQDEKAKCGKSWVKVFGDHAHLISLALLYSTSVRLIGWIAHHVLYIINNI